MNVGELMGSEVYDRSESGTLTSTEAFPQQKRNGCKNKNGVASSDGDKGFSLICED